MNNAWITTHTGYTAALALAQRMGTPTAYRYAEARKPGTRLPEGMEIAERWITDAWIEEAPASGQMTLF